MASGVVEKTSVTRTDEGIQREVLDEMGWDPRIQPNEIGVEVKDGIVTLTGWVDSYAKRWAAEEAAHRVRAVLAVANDLAVRLPSASERLDADLAAATIHALAWDAAIPTANIEITVSRGWVTLKGEVEWGFQRLDADKVVLRLAGVKGVTNLITVKPRLFVENIASAISRALERNALIEAHGITVETQGTKVVLKGKVRSYAEKESAEFAAWSAPGVTAVENRLIVALFTPIGRS